MYEPKGDAYEQWPKDVIETFNASMVQHARTILPGVKLISLPPRDTRVFKLFKYDNTSATVVIDEFSDYIDLNNVDDFSYLKDMASKAGFAAASFFNSLVRQAQLVHGKEILAIDPFKENIKFNICINPSDREDVKGWMAWRLFFAAAPQVKL